MPASRWPSAPRGGSARTSTVERVRQEARQERQAGPPVHDDLVERDLTAVGAKSVVVQ